MSLSEQLDTSTPTGKMVFKILGAVAVCDRQRKTIVILFPGAWLGVLRFGIRFFGVSPAVPWALMAATVFGSGFLEYRLQKAALQAGVAAPTGEGISSAVDDVGGRGGI